VRTDLSLNVSCSISVGEVDIFSGDDRLIFGGGVKYTTEEITGLQNFYSFLRSKKEKLPKEAYGGIYV